MLHCSLNYPGAVRLQLNYDTNVYGTTENELTQLLNTYAKNTNGTTIRLTVYDKLPRF